jgi:hypothetical protein
MLKKAHLRRYGVPRPPCHVTRETIGRTNFRLRGPDMAPHSPYAHLVKPVDPSALLAAIRAVFSAAREA